MRTSYEFLAATVVTIVPLNIRRLNKHDYKSRQVVMQFCDHRCRYDSLPAPAVSAHLT